jgi:phospholipid transport system substrate-binding protein
MFRLIASICIAIVVLLAPALSRAADLGPDEIVRQVTADVLESVQKDKQLQSGDRRRALALAEEKILPLIDFEQATQLAVGRAWRQATPEQRTRLVTEFRSMLVRIYSNALGVYRGQTMRVQPVRMAKDATDVTVRNQYLSPGKPPLAVDYSMRKVDGTWKIYDIVAEGISLVLTYRGEFEQVVQQGGIDGLIKQLAEKNAPPRERSSS